MKSLTICFLTAATAVLANCAKHDNSESRKQDSLESRERISYYDRNGDGKVDQEKHQYRDVADADWELRDEDYDGSYEKRILYGFAVTESAVDLRVPAGVKIEPTP